MTDRPSIDALIVAVSTHQTEWYRTLWGATTDFALLPLVRRADFLRTALSKRRYKDEKALVKIVHTPQGPFLSEWAFEDISQEPWGVVSERPFVYMTDPHSAIEKSMWCYEQNRVPLIGEKNPDIAAISAKKYQVDSLIADPVSVMKLLPYLQGRAHKLASLTLVADTFDPGELTSLAAYADEVRLVLALPETGVLGVATLAEPSVFIPPKNVFVECVNGELVFTKTVLLVTPVIRYATGIRGALMPDGQFMVTTYA